MPGCYAHYRFGKALLPQLPPDVRQCIGRFRRMYDMGLNGPDILCYYNPLMKNAVSDLCSRYHSQNAGEFFVHACAQATSEAARAYLYGLLAHVCLDAACRPLLEQKAASGQPSRETMEAEFDRYLMETDGIPAPHAQDLSPRLKLTRGECMTVAAFYPPATGSNVSASVRHLRLLWKLSASKNRSKRAALLRKLCPSLCDHLIPMEADPSLLRTDSELLVRYGWAMQRYVQMLPQLQAHLRTGAPLGEDFGIVGP